MFLFGLFISKNENNIFVLILVHILDNFHFILPLTTIFGVFTLGQVLCCVLRIRGERWTGVDFAFTDRAPILRVRQIINVQRNPILAGSDGSCQEKKYGV